MLEKIEKSSLNKSTSAIDEKNRRRSERVVLRVPVHLSTVIPDGKQVSMEAYTLVVNAHGGLLVVGLEMVKGQQIRLSNSKSERVTTAKVVRAEASGEGSYSVAFEFESPKPYFWPVSFPPQDWLSAA